MSGLILSLCDFTGEWPRPYREAGYRVELVDVKHGQDVRLMHRPEEPVIGILAAPPCTVFASSGARWPRSDDDYRDALAIVDACLRLVTVCRPVFWALENPVGKLVRWLGKPRLYFNPCDYGDSLDEAHLSLGRVQRPAPESRRTRSPRLSRLVRARRQERADQDAPLNDARRLRPPVLSGERSAAPRVGACRVRASVAPHGTRTRYFNRQYRCRCEACKAAARDYWLTVAKPRRAARVQEAIAAVGTCPGCGYRMGKTGHPGCEARMYPLNDPNSEAA